MRPVPGDPVPPWRTEVSGERMKVLAALIQDPNPIHFDPAAVAALGMGDRIVNQGPINLAYVMNLLQAWGGPGTRLRRIQVRFLGNVLAGDDVVAGGVVTAVAGMDVELDVWLDVDGGERVLSGRASVTLAVVD